MMPLLSTELAHEIDRAFEIPCESVNHQGPLEPASEYGIQRPVKACGCRGLAVPHCPPCKELRLQIDLLWSEGTCVRCGGRDATCPVYVRWEPIPR